MRSPKHIAVITYFASRAIFYMVLVAVWYWCFPNVLRSIEETAFWTDAPDMTHIMYHWPADAPAIISQYFAQFLASRITGAALMGLFPLLMLLAFDGVSTLILTVCARRAAVSAATLHICRIAVHATACAMMVATIAIIAANGSLRGREQTARIEHMAADRQWQQLLDETYPHRYELDDNLMAYSLLALSEVGQLPNRLFHYPVKDIESVFAHNRNFRFNSYFCHELHLPNEAIRYAFEEGQYMPAGASFGTMRRMVDWILEKGDDPELADFYLNILSHSSCHDDFIVTRRIYMAQTPLKQREVEPEFVGSPSFLHEAALVIERDPYNVRARDYLLCGLLLTGNTEGFYDIFKRIFVETSEAAIPTHYNEALLMLEASHPEIDSSYDIPIELETSYRKFTALCAQGERGKNLAQKLYPETYWTYLLRLSAAAANSSENASDNPAEIKITGASHFD